MSSLLSWLLDVLMERNMVVKLNDPSCHARHDACSDGQHTTIEV